MGLYLERSKPCRYITKWYKSRPFATTAKKKGWRWKRTHHSHRGKQDPEKQRLKQADLDTLKQAAADGYLELKYRVGVGMLPLESS